MNWLERLKSSKACETNATETTKTDFVVSVAPTLGPLNKIAGAQEAANSPTLAPSPLTAAVDIGTIRPPGLSPLLLAASLALDASIAAAGPWPRQDPDNGCWPHSNGMNGAEIERFTARLYRFMDKGLELHEGEALADTLVLRDRQQDGRRLCLECTHLGGSGEGSWRCGNWKAAGVSLNPRDAQLPSALVMQLQRCDGFDAHLPTPSEGHRDGTYPF